MKRPVEEGHGGSQTQDHREYRVDHDHTRPCSQRDVIPVDHAHGETGPRWTSAAVNHSHVDKIHLCDRSRTALAPPPQPCRGRPLCVDHML